MKKLNILLLKFIIIDQLAQKYLTILQHQHRVKDFFRCRKPYDSKVHKSNQI